MRVGLGLDRVGVDAQDGLAGPGAGHCGTVVVMAREMAKLEVGRCEVTGGGMSDQVQDQTSLR